MSELLGCGSVFWQAHTASLDGEVVWRREEVEAGVVVVKNPDGRTELLAHGDPRRLALVLECARGEGIEQPTSAMLTRGTPLSEELRAWLPPYWGNEWDFYWTRQPLAPHEGDAVVRRIDAEEARPVVAAANPRSEAFDDFESYRWYGIEKAGELASVLGARDERDATGRLNSYLGGLGTLPDFRGHGLGGAIMTGVTARELESHPIVTFGMWAENPARRLYDSLGYVHGGGEIIADSAPFGPH